MMATLKSVATTVATIVAAAASLTGLLQYPFVSITDFIRHPVYRVTSLRFLLITFDSQAASLDFPFPALLP